MLFLSLKKALEPTVASGFMITATSDISSFKDPADLPEEELKALQEKPLSLTVLKRKPGCRPRSIISNRTGSIFRTVIRNKLKLNAVCNVAKKGPA
ncbi:hypothetical protein XI25_28685 [Paenibacillus sp. DMB20]|nr:hypothetical protein XI25_28685 [Paenibacillus sp. DMB20]